jgi:AcrR family transcriptional regulator
MSSAEVETLAETPASQSRARRRNELRLRVLEAARSLFDETGYDETKVSEICAHAGIAYGTFFNYFSGKGDLILGLAEQTVSQFAENLERIAKQPGTIEDQLIELFEGDAEKMDPAHRGLLGLIWKATVADAPVDYDSRFHAAFEAFLAEGVARGTVRDDVPIETLAEVVGSTTPR